MDVTLSTQFEDQWVASYMSRIFPWALNYSCGGAEYPYLFGDWKLQSKGNADAIPLAAKERWRRLAGAAILTPGLYAQQQAMRPEAQIAADWMLVPAARNLHWRYEVLHSSFLSCTQKVRAGVPLNVNLEELVSGATCLWKRLQKGSITVRGHTIPLNGEIGMIFRADDLSTAERVILASYFKTTRSIAGCQAIRRRIGHCLFGMRAVGGEAIFVTFSPNRRHSGLLCRLSRLRKNDPTLQTDSDVAHARARFAGSSSPSCFLDGFPDEPAAVEGECFFFCAPGSGLLCLNLYPL